ncbi:MULTISPECIES: hypothetical protein [unclassified Streptomyces]|uniref:hypothetical protein n=1 Tax=unclassified Streptomyces TaxID=2593676 RepID=UPI003816C07C
MLVTDTSDDLSIGLVLLLNVIGLGVTPWLAVRGVRLLTRRKNRDTHTVVRGTAALAWACAIGMYTWGVLHFLLLDESSQTQACQERVGSERARSVSGHEYSFLPLRFRCQVTTGETYDAVVPGYVNPAAGAFGLAAAALTFVARPKYWYEEEKK